MPGLLLVQFSVEPAGDLTSCVTGSELVNVLTEKVTSNSHSITREENLGIQVENLPPKACFITKSMVPADPYSYSSQSQRELSMKPPSLKPLGFSILLTFHVVQVSSMTLRRTWERGNVKFLNTHINNWSLCFSFTDITYNSYLILNSFIAVVTFPAVQKTLCLQFHLQYINRDTKYNRSPIDAESHSGKQQLMLMLKQQIMGFSLHSLPLWQKSHSRKHIDQWSRLLWVTNLSETQQEFTSLLLPEISIHF